MKLKDIKKELFYIRKSFFQYKKGWQYLYFKYIFAPRILKIKRRLDKPINQPDLSVHILTCHRDVVMTTWALCSFYHNSGLSGRLYIHNDGSLTDKDEEVFKFFFPESLVVNSSNFLQDYSEEINRYVVIKNFRFKYSNFSFKKIVDPYFVSNKKYQLLIDSDILWFSEAHELIDVVSDDSKISFMQVNNTKTDFSFIDSKKPEDDKSYFNAGIVFWHKDNFNMKSLSDFFEKINIDNPRNLHFADQLGYAYCLDNLNKLPESSYQIKKIDTNNLIAMHYTSPRRPLFYIEGISKLRNLISK